MNQSSWSFSEFLDVGLRERVFAVAGEASSRISKLGKLKEAARAAKEQTAYPQVMGWTPQGIGQGSSGIALFASHLDNCFPGQGWDAYGKRHLEFACQSVSQDQVFYPGLFGGIAGVAYAACSLSRDGTRYEGLIRSLEDALFPLVRRQVSELIQLSGFSVSAFDVISGLSGITRYLLARNTAASIDLLKEVLAALVLICEPASIPRWHTPQSMLLDPSMRNVHGHGNCNCGLSHGIPGPLAALAIAHRQGVTIQGQDRTIEYLGNWLVNHSVIDEWGVNWPSAVPLVETAEGVALAESAHLAPTRAGWCYGSPGVARAIWIAGEAIGKSEFQQCSLDAMRALCARPLPKRNIDSPTFCHGKAGLLQVLLRFSMETRDEVLVREALSILESLIDDFEPDSILGYRDLETGGNATDNPGLLEGTPGVVLVLLAAAVDEVPSWDRVFMLS